MYNCSKISKNTRKQVQQIDITPLGLLIRLHKNLTFGISPVIWLCRTKYHMLPRPSAVTQIEPGALLCEYRTDTP